MSAFGGKADIFGGKADIVRTLCDVAEKTKAQSLKASSRARMRPLRVVALNTAEGWSRDVTEDIGKLQAFAKPNPLLAHDVHVPFVQRG